MKSPIRIKFSYCPSCESKLLPIQFQWLAIKFFLGLQERERSDFFFLNFFSRKNPSTDQPEITIVEGISSLIYKSMPPPFAFLSNLYEVAWLSRCNCTELKDESISVLDVISKSIFLIITGRRESNSLRSEFILSQLNISLLMFLWCIFSKDLRGPGRISQLGLDEVLCISSKIGSSTTGLWSKLTL